MVSEDEQAFSGLLWSAGGSPPFGGISYDEAKAVYELTESFLGKGMPSKPRYDIVRRHLRWHPKRERTLDLFHCYDEIVSESPNYSQEVAKNGLTIASSMQEPGAIGLFRLFEAQVLTREGRTADAAEPSVEALDDLLSAAEKEPACGHRVAQAGQNAVLLTAMAGDKPRAAR